MRTDKRILSAMLTAAYNGKLNADRNPAPSLRERRLEKKILKNAGLKKIYIRK